VDSLQLARSGAEAELKEIADNVGVIRAFKSLFVARSADLFSRTTMDGALKRELEATLKLSSTDLNPSLAGLFVQIHGVFERYVSGLTRACVERIAVGKSCYSELPTPFSKSHTAHAGRALGYISEGHINGISFDFSALVSNLSVCFADTKPPLLSPSVFTVTMGNCTPDRIKALFGILDLTDPFDDRLGSHVKIKALEGYRGGARALSKQAKDDWKDAIIKRNRIVHDATSVPTVNESDLVQLSSLTLALIASFEDKVRDRYP
jgi:RiboL-PSP-HEPN